MKSKKIIKIAQNIIKLFLFFSVPFLFAVDWPQSAQTPENFAVDFARPCGGMFSTGLIFAEQGSVKASDTATILLTITDSDNLSMFDSPLGNSLIAVSEENLMNIYGNLDEIKIKATEKVIIEGEEIATSGRTGWQKEEWGLEFKVADIQSRTVINPLVLLPRIIETKVPLLYNISLVNKKGTTYNLNQTKALPAGTYSLYFEGYDTQPPFKAAVSINGKESEIITYNILKKTGRSLSVDGKRNYPFNVIFPDKKKQLLATTSLTKGKALLVIQTFDLNGNEKSMSYTFEVY
ncbi:MAG: hypothetical protein GX297_05240 [Treponema sp.]|jgi:hypothetical protein|nr:hypothetical protein [Treponema sp.]